MPIFESEQRVPRPRSEVFAFFSDAANLGRITPKSLQFQMLSPLPIAMRAGTLIDYRVRLMGVPFRWRTSIVSFEPEESFEDIQLRGPYRSWHHRHEFLVDGDGTIMRDRVEYQVPFGALGRLVAGGFVRWQLEQIFAYRRKVIEELFG